ncbi:recombinase [Bacillus toyonensis]|uniref:recombinase family protein n=1 Tax=Bacillus toyonensis TaxID=155322 RepID=UPI000BFDFD47|nr:recombinase family protein [Bacillus toyonensis]PHF35400.1 recombinase [Bacillus toyonensis]
MNKKKKEIVAVYIRKSREDEGQEALMRQQEVLIELCEKNNWNYELFVEVGSSQDLDRVELQRMLSKIKHFEFDAVVCSDLDRLSRNTGHFGQIKEILISAGVFVVTPSRHYDFSNNEDDFVSDIFSVIAKQEYQTIKKRLIRGSRQSAKSGNWLGKRIPIGYEYNRMTKRLELSEDAPVIKRMFMLYLEGISTKDIAYKFTNEVVSTTVNMKWTPAGVSRMLNNIVYAGHSLYGKTTQPKIEGKRVVRQTLPEEQILVENTHEAIVSPEVWNEVQKVKQDRNSRPPALKLGKHKFSGLIRCGLCGAVHSFQTSRYKRKRISSCQTRTYNETLDSYSMCSNSGANLVEFEELFYLYFKKHVGQLERYVELIKNSGSNDTPNVEEEIDVAERKIDKLNKNIKRVQQGFIMEIFTQEQARVQIQQMKQQIASLEEQINELKEQGNVTEVDRTELTLEKMKQFLTHGDNIPEREANTILREFVDTVIYTKTGTEIKLNIVMK